MDKLKTICEKMNISTEGTKNQLITRILDIEKAKKKTSYLSYRNEQ